MSAPMKRWEGLPLLFDPEATAHGRLFAYLEAPWEALSALDAYLDMLLAEDPFAAEGFPDRGRPAHSEETCAWGLVAVSSPASISRASVHIGADCVVETGAYIRGPAWIGNRCEIRQGAYLRGTVLAGDDAVLGHACEFKRCIILEAAQAPHFNYVGDSIMGVHAHIGAGVILSNVRLDKRHVRAALLGAAAAAEQSLPEACGYRP